MTHSYDDEFYSRWIEGSTRSAVVVLGMLYEIFQPASVIDVGCGQGGWLAVAESYGARVLKGVDGYWVATDKLLSPNIDFTPMDLERAPNLTVRYDLCISLEVAEHITQQRAQPFVDMLCAASDVVLFSAAIPFQAGRDHVNERWQSYWVSLFDLNDYQCCDVFRGAIWDNDRVDWWYRQNTLLFVRRASNVLTGGDLRKRPRTVLDIVHPLNYEEKLRALESLMLLFDQPTLRFCLGSLYRFVRHKLTRGHAPKLWPVMPDQR